MAPPYIKQRYIERIKPPDERVDVRVIDNEAFVSLAVRELMERTQEDLKVFGLDCEWNLVTKKGGIHKPDILQIATINGFCAIFRLHRMKTIPPNLRGFLEDPFFAKVGVGVVEDSDKLKQCFDVQTQGVVDVRYLADDLDIPPRGLSHLANTVLGIDLTKHHYSFHQWTGKLSYAQTQYAALDAVYSARVFYKMSHDRMSQVYEDDWRNWSHEEYHERTLAMWDKYMSKPFEFTKCKFYFKEVVKFMLSYSDLNTEPPVDMEEIHSKQELTAITESRGPKEGARTLRPVEPERWGSEVPERLGSEEPEQSGLQDIEAFPTFEAKFSMKKKERQKAKKEIKRNRIPKRYLKRYIKRVESRGWDASMIPTELLPRAVLDEHGKLDMNKVNQKIDLVKEKAKRKQSKVDDLEHTQYRYSDEC